jgi:hypothetical protein
MTERRPSVFRIGRKARGGYPFRAEFDGHLSHGVIPPTLPLLGRDELRQAQT